MRKQLNKSAIQELNKEIEEQFNVPNFFSKKDTIELLDFEHVITVVRDGKRLFFYHESKLVPTLRLLLEQNILKAVIVDMGAVKFVTNGADIMRPGIVDLAHEIKQHEFVVVADETHKKPLAVCEALLSGEEMFRAEKGKVLKNIHWVGDKLWNS